MRARALPARAVVDLPRLLPRELNESGEALPRIRSAREEAAAADQLRLGRAGRELAPIDGTPRARDSNRARARALQERRSVGRGLAAGRSDGVVQYDPVSARLREVGTIARARRIERSALGQRAGRA